MDPDRPPPRRQRRPPPDPGLALFSLGLACGAAFAALVALLVTRYGEAPDLALYRDVRDLVERDFVLAVDRREMVDHALEAMVGELDPYSHYYPSGELEQLSRETGGVYTGIGALFRPPYSDGRVLLPMPGSPAERAGLRVGDRVLEVDGAVVADMGEGDFERSLRVGPNRALELRIASRDGTEKRVTLTPEEVVEPSLRHRALLDPERGLGYVSILTFTQQTPAELDAALEALVGQGLRGLVLDLRGNPGGVLAAAVRLANRFVAEGVLVATRTRGPDQESLARADEARWAGLPLVVLVDGGSASASEVMAGALQDHRVAVLVGTRTYGKSAVQSLNRFEEREAVLKLTSGYYTTPAGQMIDRGVVGVEHAGLEPDLVVPLDAGRERAIHGWLQTFGPPDELVPELEAWERDDGVQLFPRHPADPQLEVALELLRGHRPGPRAGAVALLDPEEARGRGEDGSR